MATNRSSSTPPRTVAARCPPLGDQRLRRPLSIRLLARPGGAWLIEPERILAPCLAALAGKRQVGMLVPLPEQIETEGAKWRTFARPPLCAAQRGLHPRRGGT